MAMVLESTRSPARRPDRRERDEEEDEDNDSDAGRDEAADIPSDVRTFLISLLRAVETRNMAEINKLYEIEFNELTKENFTTMKGKKPTKKSWPSEKAVKEYISTDQSEYKSLFLILYKQLYYRHLTANRLKPYFESHRGAWDNYCQLLDTILEDLVEGEELFFSLPVQWLWDILDEFIYHYHVYCAFRDTCSNRMGKQALSHKQREKEDFAAIKQSPEVFDTTKVLQYLHRLIRFSHIEEWLEDPSNPEDKGGAFKDESIRLIGYFALMQLLRMHCLLGDYQLAMETIDSVDFHAEVPLFYRIPACQVTLFYYMGFSYMMMRRYVDAKRTFSDILVFLSMTSGVNKESYQFDAMKKMQEKMFQLLMMCDALCPQPPLEESLRATIRDKKEYNDNFTKLIRGEVDTFETLFKASCPKFVKAALPDFDNLESFAISEEYSRQTELFKAQIKQQQALPKIGSYMKLYTSLKMSKLAQLCEMGEEGLRDQLMCVVHKARQLVRHSGAPLSGRRIPCGEVEFYVDGDMVHINAHKAQRPHSDVFHEQILKFQDILRKMGK